MSSAREVSGSEWIIAAQSSAVKELGGDRERQRWEGLGLERWTFPGYAPKGAGRELCAFSLEYKQGIQEG